MRLLQDLDRVQLLINNWFSRWCNFYTQYSSDKYNVTTEVKLLDKNGNSLFGRVCYLKITRYHLDILLLFANLEYI